MQNQERQGMFLMLNGAFFFALMSLCTKLIPTSIPAIEILFTRSLIGFLCIIPYLVKNKTGFSGVDRPALLLRALCGFAALLCFFICLQTLKLANAVMLNYTSSIFTAILAGLFLRERVTKKTMALVCVSFAGVYCLVRPGFTEYGSGSLLGLLSGFLAACAYTLIRRLRQTDSPYCVILYFTGLSTILSAPFAICFFKKLSAMEMIFMIGVGLFGHLGQLNMTSAYMKARASIVANFAYFTVFFSSILGIIILDEPVSITTLAGSGLIIGSGILLGGRLAYDKER